ncbi:hypothetical protein CANCADRAFT_32334 [Tortispora caseinolytica NRRL Y-17796]|uniref:Uncharacterized protein n=1 Tax=Tortispora caseinolytica NRRL Y-17796 TaxID=767744 RepID=A0A1E4TAS9_9ASCO|nr:hypothetical protein CANCADRAFT_32334 [Tortispora caseinolytica NRRL Y-17796]
MPQYYVHVLALAYVSFCIITYTLYSNSVRLLDPRVLRALYRMKTFLTMTVSLEECSRRIEQF